MSRSSVDRATLTGVEKRVEEGLCFECSTLQSVANSGATIEWLFITGDKRVIVYDRKVTPNGDEMTYQAFKGATVSANGTAQTIVKRNGNSPISTTVQIFSAPTITDDGAGIPPVYIPGSSGVGQTSNGQFDREGFVRVLEPNTTYMTRVTNSGSKNPAKVEWYLMWAELQI